MNQIIYAGYGKYKKLKDILNKHNPKKIFVVTGKKSFELCGAKNLFKVVFNKYDTIKFNDFDPNPKIEDIKKGIKEFKKSKSDLIIGIGGGSVLDMAKSISILYTQEDDIEKIINNNSLTTKKKIPTIAIPTTAGSGAESTCFSVIYINKQKFSLENDLLMPDYAILDPVFTESLPPYVAACSGMDALCHAIESYWSVNSTEESRKYSKKALKIILNNIVNAVNNPDKISRKNMLLGSNLAGKAINIAKTTAAHSLSYPLTSYYNIPHGHAVALTLPYLMRLNCDVDSHNLQDNRGVMFVRKIMFNLFKILNVDTYQKARDKFISTMKEIGLETRLLKLGINKEGISIIVKNGFNPKRMINNPRIISKDDLVQLLKNIL
ncbi:MAG: phosphonoacetaldehyde reductase [Candidatus Marinimicrobia bacterium]|nr:phosphonoacetaldehyde reductase [Candidatus Neomarinimicrobiota bacterium]